MDQIICLEGDALRAFLVTMESVQKAAPYRLRLAVDGGQLKVKVNEFTWSPPLGLVTVEA